MAISMRDIFRRVDIPKHRTPILQPIFSAVFGLLLSFFVVSGEAAAADILISDRSDCRIEINGPISDGDYDRVSALKDHLIVDDGESTARSVVCLDSPGGNLHEGIEIARFFLENGVGTRILEGAECMSVCAIMFMMGNATGSEVRFINRKMHATAQLGSGLIDLSRR